MTIGYGPRIVTDGLVLALDAGDRNSYSGSGTTWTDLSGLGNNGTLTNGPTYSSANGGSIVFDGTNDYVATSNMFDPNSDFTFSVWSKINSSAIYTWISKRSDVGSIQIRVNSNTVEIVDSVVVNVGTFSNSTINSNQIYNVVVNRSGNNYSCYINGSFISQFTSTNSYTYAADTIGSNYFSVTNEYFSGNIYQMICYNRALTSTEIQQNFNATRNRFGI